jgi:tetratricopeptide (TPR) repeat protein
MYPLALLLCGFACAAARAEDAVYLAAPNSPQARAKVTGRVLDYNGRDLLLDTGGNQKRYPADQVVGVDSEWTPTQLAADELFARREYAEALVKYEEAVRSEPRRWVQRKLVAQMIWCLRNLEQYRRAAELFLALTRDDPAMLYFSCIPLRWLPAQTPADLEKKSREWLASDSPVAVLVGASQLISSADQAEVVKRLEVLTKAKDARIAALARALIWNATFAAASSKQLSLWSDDIETFPEAIRAGPYYVLGRALAHHKQPADAAIDLLHVPILYPEDRPLAAAALLAAGRALEDDSQADAAHRLYRELLAEYPKSRAAGEAQQRIDETGKKSSRRVDAK